MKLTAQQLIETLHIIYGSFEHDIRIIDNDDIAIRQAIEAVKTLQQIYENGKIGKLDGWYCSDIAKAVLHE